MDRFPGRVRDTHPDQRWQVRQPVDNDTVGIETWVNERYIRDISRKIRSCLRFKIQRGEYLGNAPFGYRKSSTEKNKLVVVEEEADTVRLIFKLYRSGLGYSSIAKALNEKGLKSPKGTGWNRITVRRILCSRVYVGDTVQGVSEKVSFKSKKTRRLPQEEWVITECTHEGIISREEFQETQKIRESRKAQRWNAKGNGACLKRHHMVRGCGSVMYARKKPGGVAFVCGNYLRNGRNACSSHYVREWPIVESICEEVAKIFRESDYTHEQEMFKGIFAGNELYEKRMGDIRRQMEINRRRQEMIYRDRLDGIISRQLFDRMNEECERRIKHLENEAKSLEKNPPVPVNVRSLADEAASVFLNRKLTPGLARLVVKRITVFDENERPYAGTDCRTDVPVMPHGDVPGSIVIEFRF
jgi:site-specific DNA recombinase